MKLSWRDMVAGVLAALGAVVVFAKLQDYTWWLIGSYKGALAVIAVLGLAIFVTYAVELFSFATFAVTGELFLWFIAATVIIGSLFTATTQFEFISAASLIGLSWLAEFSGHAWGTTHKHGPHYLAAG